MGFHFQLFSPPTCPLSPVIPNNGRHLCITAAAGTELAMTSSRAFVRLHHVLFDVPFSTRVRILQPEDLHHPRGVAGSGFRPLPNIPYCCLP